MKARITNHSYTSLCAATVLVLAACGGSAPAPPAPMVDTQQAIAAATEGNPFPATSQVVFRWDIREPNLRVGGTGVARMQPPDRARLDLFLENGQSVLAVALVDDDLRAPSGTPLQVVPSPPLLWASLGVFRPGDAGTLLGAEQRDEGVRLRYQLADGDELHYQMRDHTLIGVELFRDGRALHAVSLERDDGQVLPSEATYRNLASFRELKVTVESVESVRSFPASIWSPHR